MTKLNHSFNMLKQILFQITTFKMGSRFRFQIRPIRLRPKFSNFYMKSHALRWDAKNKKLKEILIYFTNLKYFYKQESTHG